MALVRVHLLGGFLVDFAERNLPPIPSAVGRSLFAYLVTNRSRRHTRDLLAGTFWPELPESAARRRLSQALWQIQAALNEASPDHTFINTSAGDVAFDPPAGTYWLDVAEFDRHVAAAQKQRAAGEPSEAGDLEAAVALYRGEFLAGFYDDWTTLERERLRVEYLSSLERLIAIHKGRADYETALSFARRLSLHDPLRESAHREVMRLCFLLGRSNEALQQYERCVSTLAEELNTVPTAETDALRDHITQLRAKGETAFAPTLKSPLLDGRHRIPLVGRIEERAAILHRMDDVVAGRGRMVFVEGRSGVGKTRMLEQLIDDAQWRGLSVLRASCTESEILHPFGALRKSLESGLTRFRIDQLNASLHPATLGDLAWILPGAIDQPPAAVSRGLDGEAALRRLEQALEATLVSMAELNPTVLVIDDVQWIDHESVVVLGRLTQRLADLGLLVCLSYRTAGARQRPDLWRQILDIDATSKVERVAIDSLDQEEVAALITESLGGTSVGREVVEGLFVETGGNPLFILESLREWHERIRDELDGDGRLPTEEFAHDLPVAGGVAQVIRRRLEDLPTEPRVALETAAVIGTGVDIAVLGRAARLSRESTLAALQRLIGRGAIVERPQGYGFAHDQVRRVVLDSLSDEESARLHGRVGSTLEELAPEGAETLAYHFTAAGHAGKAYMYSIESARRSKVLGAYGTAAGHYEQAAAWQRGPGRFEMLSELDDVMDVLGRRTDQHGVLEEMESFVAGPTDEAELARRRSRLLDHEGHYKEAISAAERAVAGIESSGGERDRARMKRSLGVVLSHSGRPAEAVPHLEAAVALITADASGAALAEEAAALCDLGNVLCDVQEYERAGAALARALDRYEEAQDRYGVAETLGQLAIVRMEQGDGSAAVDLYTRALEMSRDLDYRRGEAVNLANLGNALYFQGDVGAALRRYGEAAEVFARIGDRRGSALLRANAASVRLNIVGDDSVESDVNESLVFFEGEDHTWGQAFCHEHLAAIAHHRGDSRRALRHLQIGMDLLDGGGHRWVEVHLLRLWARISLDLGDLETAERTVRRASAMCSELGLEEVAPTVESIAALVALEQGDLDDALARARHASASLDGRVEQAYAVWYRRYVVADAVGERDEARESLSTAVAMLGELISSLSFDDRASSEVRVTDHRAILDARDRAFTRSVVFEVPRLGVPLGRAIAPEEMIRVSVTVSDPADFTISTQRDRRRARLRRMVDEAEEQGAAMRVKDLASLLDVSVATVRRDLGDLRRSGIEVRTRGSR